MFVFLFSPAGHLLTIDVKADDSVESLRSKAIARIGSSSPRSQIELVYEDVVLEDHQSLQAYGIKEGAVIDIKAAASSSGLSSPPVSTYLPSSKLSSLYSPSPAKPSFSTAIPTASEAHRPTTAPSALIVSSALYNHSNSSSENDSSHLSSYKHPDFSRPSTSSSSSSSFSESRSPAAPYSSSTSSSHISALQPVPPAYHLITFTTPLRVHHPLGSGRKMAMAKDAPSLHVFDLDDTLARNGVLPANVKQCLRQLRATGARLAVASFNASAVEVLRENGVELFFDVIVCGWSPIARKTEHVAKAIEPLGWEQTVDGPRLYFFDDVPENVMDVRAAFPLSYCVRVYSVDVLPMLVSHCMQLDNQRLSSIQRLSPLSASNKTTMSSPGGGLLSPTHTFASPSSSLSAASTPQTTNSILQSMPKLSLDDLRTEFSHGVSLGKPTFVKGLH